MKFGCVKIQPDMVELFCLAKYIKILANLYIPFTANLHENLRQYAKVAHD
jgi:hypothetical protein